MKNIFFIKHAHFMWSLTKRDIAMRFRGSLLGAVWLLINPLFTFALYFTVFSVIMKVRWSTINSDGTVVEHPGALLLFSGLIAYWFFSECLTRAPGLMRENVSYVKKVVFPLEILPIVAVLSALFTACVNLCLLFIFYLFVIGIPSWHILYIPLLFLILALGSLGVVYVLSALGVYIPDIRSLIGPISMMFMFLTPIMYPLSFVPKKLQVYIKLNPLTGVVETLRQVLFEATSPSITSLAVLTISALLLCFSGYWSFQKLRKGFADVI